MARDLHRLEQVLFREKQVFEASRGVEFLDIIENCEFQACANLGKEKMLSRGHVEEIESFIDKLLLLVRIVELGRVKGLDFGWKKFDLFRSGVLCENWGQSF